MKSLDLNKLNAKYTIISSEEALKDIIPIDWSINEDTHVYCTKCKHGTVLLCDYHFKNPISKPCCDCDPYDPEDSRPFKERPYYISE